MKVLFVFLGAFALAMAIFFSSYVNVECKCGCPNCGKSCVNQCDGV